MFYNPGEDPAAGARPKPNAVKEYPGAAWAGFGVPGENPQVFDDI